MSKIVVIALNTYKESIRDKLLYNLLIFALLLIGGSVILSTLTVGERSKIIIDLSLASLNLFGVLIAVFVGIGLVSKEIEKKTIYTIIAKPVHRWQFLAGKYLGLLITLAVNVGLMTVCVYAVQLAGEWTLRLELLQAVWLIYVELMVVTAIALLCSTFTTSTLAAIFTLALYVIGHFSSSLKEFANKIGSDTTTAIADVLYYSLPNLEHFNIKGEVVHHIAVSADRVLWSTFYGLAYISALLLLAAIIFQRRDFK
ncbi:MAG TPA: ABC transporter permease [Nitrospiria bacterium]|nr:ABC transporter permease [Nitrospiria bacterium]